MAIQIRRGSNAEWEVNNSNIVVGEPAVATDSKRAFIGTASGAYMELANLEAIAPAYDPGNSYMVDDYVSYQGKLYVCTVPTSGAWNASCWQVTSLGQALAENAYSNFETYTMSGDIVSFPNGAGGIPVKDLKADVVAVQNLNGYDYPWVGGAGKNKLEVVATTTEKNGITFTVNADGSVKATGTASANVYFQLNNDADVPSGSYIISGCPSGGTGSTYFVYTQASDGTHVNYDYGSGGTLSFDDSYTLQFYISIRNGYACPTGGLMFYPMLRLATETDATFEPYSNICPISGWDEVNVCVAGVNMISPSMFTNGYIINDDGSVTSHSSYRYTPDYIGLHPNTTYTFYCNKIYTGNYSARFALYDENKGFIIRVGDLMSGTGAKTLTFTTTADTACMRMFCPVESTATNIQVSQGSTITEYTPYNGNTYTIDLDDTRYGGTLDVTTGVLTVTYGRLNLGDISWQYLNGDIFRGTNTSTVAPNMEIATNNEVPLNAICESYKVDKYNGSGTKLVGLKDVNQIRIQDPQYSHDATGASALHDKVNNTYLVYKLVTPLTVQLTPTQVKTVLGQNNIWADSGSVEVTYRISNVQ